MALYDRIRDPEVAEVLESWYDATGTLLGVLADDIQKNPVVLYNAHDSFLKVMRTPKSREVLLTMAQLSEQGQESNAMYKKAFDIFSQHKLNVIAMSPVADRTSMILDIGGIRTLTEAFGSSLLPGLEQHAAS